MAVNVQPELDKLSTSVALNDLMFRALDHGVDSVSTGEDLIPFLLVESADGQRTIRRFSADRLEWAVVEAKAAACELPGEINRYAIAYDGYVTVAGERFDTVVVEAGERGAGPGVSLGQRYRKPSGPNQFETVGNPILVGSVENRFERSA